MPKSRVKQVTWSNLQDKKQKKFMEQIAKQDERISNNRNYMKNKLKKKYKISNSLGLTDNRAYNLYKIIKICKLWKIKKVSEVSRKAREQMKSCSGLNMSDNEI